MATKKFRVIPVSYTHLDVYKRQAIVTDMLTDEEINWFNEYHKMVYSRLSPQLNKEEQEWLKEKTSPLKR